jgi:hypothetical protein
VLNNFGAYTAQSRIDEIASLGTPAWKKAAAMR